ncbi:hypothetical protein GUJ93_ZPchr0008g13042 [Zizania palustris]|uniref:Uncharacterized protein n=1 Tax=Zizania palustris TaxID=103762 RepID=A0A8J5VIC4_ZIZPA|nr:hypothetical protein GUJ93_ZPchr0008g13042 [Zizania palustris]
MASPTAATTAMGTKLGHLPRLRDIIDHDYEEDDDFVEEEDGEELEEWDMSKRMTRLSVEGSDGGDADDEDDGYRSGGGEAEEDGEEVRSDVNGEYLVGGGGGGQWQPYGNDHRSPQLAPSSASLPGTPDRWATAQSSWWCSKDYASETEAAQWPCGGSGGGGGDKRRMRHRRERMMREVWLDRAWQMRKHRRQPLPQGQGSGVDAATVAVGAGEQGSGIQ